MEDQIIKILRKSQLSVTESRRNILEIFIQAGSALAHHDVEEKTSERFDRVTVYRTLQVFMEKGIIHTIPTTENAVLYALCNAKNWVQNDVSQHQSVVERAKFQYKRR